MTTRPKVRPASSLELLLISALAFFFFQSSSAQTPARLKSEEEQIRQMMVTMSRHLGVTCTTCHNTDNFKSNLKPEFRVAQEHMKITQLLIDQGMDGKRGPKASCYMCHRGELKPPHLEPQAPTKK